MKTALKWLFCLSKRLYKKPMFIVLISLIPISVFALRITSVQKSGFLKIAIVNAGGETGKAIINNLEKNSTIITFDLYKDEDSAVTALEANKIDSVWVFAENISEKIADFVKNPDGDNYIVHIINREDSLKTRLALEKLSGAIYPFTSRQYFLKCIRENSDFDLSALTDEQIYKYYDDYFNDDKLFKFAFPDGGGDVSANERNYMTSPIRGLLSAVVLLCGLASAMLFISDEKKGVFSLSKNSNHILISFAFQLTAVLNIGFFVFVSTFVLGVNTYFWRELLLFLIFAVNTALFCTVLQQLLNNLTLFAPAATLIAVLDVLICPIFFDYWVQKKPQLLMPNTYYINAVHSNTYLKYSLIYTAVGLLIISVMYLRKRKI